MTVLTFDKAAYSIEAAQAAAYRFIDRVTIVVSATADAVVCEVAPIQGRNIDFDATVADFKRELLDQQLRQRIGRETEAVRNLILSLAFSRTGLQQ
jgi:His-Xaa-Ser system protein HxsD